MQDFKGNELAVGDTIVFTYDSSGWFREGKILKFTKQGLRVKYGETQVVNYQSRGKTLTYTNKNESTLLNCQNRVLKIG